MKLYLKKRSIVFLLSLSSFITLLDSCSIGSNELSGDYMLWGDRKMITSKNAYYHNVIYSVVTDYAFNNKFILAEQHPEKKDLRVNLGENLLQRFQNYQLYKSNPSILNDPFYNHLKGVVKKDSVLYRNFICNGAANDESKNREISIRMAEYIVENDSYYKRILGSKINYWIINHSKDSLIGPLTQTEYFKEKKKLGIPVSLKLKFEK